MIKKILFSLISLFICVQSGYTKPVDKEAAEAIARAFSGTIIHSPVKLKAEQPETLQLAYTCTDKSTGKSVSTSYYYVFNRGKNEGFIIVSADDRAKAVLGYSDTGSFPTDNMPDNFRYWLEFYKDELKNLFEKEVNRESVGNQDYDAIRTKSYATSINPLLGKIKYGQNSPFNKICPLIPGSQTRTVTGCVATAMAQVMRFHQWPAQGKGNHAYTTKDLKIELSADFGSTAYDWSSMSESYVPADTAENVHTNAIATLMLHCGISVDMNYNKASGASINRIAGALIKYFDYDASMQLHYRNYYSTEQWSDMLKEEINNRRPVIYNGLSSTGAHSFVCDGYDANGLFHINWGWSGISDGYFELSVLSPDEQGTGGSLGGYNMQQNIFTGIRPSDGGQTESKYQVKLTTGLSAEVNKVVQGGTAVVRLGYRNLGTGSCYGYHGLGLYEADGTFAGIFYKGLFGRQEDGNIIMDTLTTGSGSDKLQWKTEIKSSLPTGTFRLYPIYHFGEIVDDNKWTIIPGELGMPSYLNANINSSGIEFSLPEENMPVLKVTDMKVTGRLYQHMTGRFEFNLQNSGTEYSGALRIKIKNPNDNDDYQIIGPEGVSIRNGEIKTYGFSGEITLPPGEYQIIVQYDSKDGYLRQISEPVTVIVAETPVESPNLSILDLKTDLDPDKINVNDEIIFKATLKNTGGYAEAKATANIYFSDGKYGDGIGNQNIYLDKDEEREFTFKGYTELENGNYYTRIYIKTNNQDWESVKPLSINKLPFRLENEGSGIETGNINQTVIYPNPAYEYLHIECAQTPEIIRIFNLAGQPVQAEITQQTTGFTVDVSNLMPGIYLIQIGTEGKTIYRKFTKK